MNGIGKYFEDLERYEDELFCTECGNDTKTFKHSRSVVHGEVWFCENCCIEKLVGKKPNEDDY